MSMPLFFPVPRYVAKLTNSSEYKPLRFWCDTAGVRCRASGKWTDRPVRLIYGSRCSITVEATPRTGVLIEVTDARGEQQDARYVLAALAYGLMDIVARESIRGQPWARVSPGLGRPKTGRARNNRERQRQFRETKNRHLKRT